MITIADLRRLYEKSGSLYEGYIIDAKTGEFVAGKGHMPDTLAQFVKDVKHKYPQVDQKKLMQDLQNAYGIATRRKDFSPDTIEVPTEALRGLKVKKDSIIPFNDLVQMFANIQALQVKATLQKPPQGPKRSPEILEPEVPRAAIHSGKTLRPGLGKSL